ncbi:MAG: discoidin domain-containing protein, partial [Tannerellaceae bacterium]|nr:discoidin domain-containing protein [Tannerellaceae bacterium]
DKRKMNVMKLSNDQNFTNWEGMDSYLIDDDHETFGHSPNSSIPAPFTIDLGRVAKLSRIVMHQRKFSDSYYNWGNPQKFEVYGCATKPSQNGDWSEWTKIMNCEIIKPSGSPSGTVTDEDITAGTAGHEFVFELSQAPIRYIRIVIQSTFGGTTFTHPADVDFYGKVVE